MQPHQPGDIVSLERRRAGEAQMQHDAEGIQVRAGVHGPVQHAELLRCAEPDRADNGVPYDATGPTQQSEVNQDGPATRAENDVRWFDILMDESKPVRGRERARHVSTDAQSVGDGQRAGAETSGHRIPVDKLKHQVGPAVDLPGGEHSGDVRMPDARQDGGFPPEGTDHLSRRDMTGQLHRVVLAVPHSAIHHS
nr:hypothetical protein [Frankia sp. R43]